MENYAPLRLRVTTPRLTLAGATDELLDRLAPAVRDGKAMASPAPFDDPISLYEEDPESRVAKWLRGIWRGRGKLSPDDWRLYFVVLVDGEPVGMQDLSAERYADFATVASFSWLSSDARGRGLGKEMRQAILHLAFAGLDARAAESDAFCDNAGSNGVSRGLGYVTNGTTWDTRLGEPAQIQRWRLDREVWEARRREDIAVAGVAPVRAMLGLG